MKLNCPHCKKEVIMEDEVKELFCCHCGKKITLIEQDAAKGLAAEAYLSEHITELFENLSVETIMEDFTKKNYEKSFLAYQEKCQKLLAELLSMYQNLDDAEKRFEPMAQRVADMGKAHVKKVGFFKRNGYIYQCNLAVAVYLLPALLNFGRDDYGKSMTDTFIKCWDGLGNHQQLQAGTFESINASFATKIFGMTIPERKKKS